MTTKTPPRTFRSVAVTTETKKAIKALSAKTGVKEYALVDQAIKAWVKASKSN